jgi:bifunctional polynucleotide phosphatase/kinase
MEKINRKRKIVNYDTDEENFEKQKKTQKNEKKEQIIEKSSNKKNQEGWENYQSVIIKDNQSISSDKVLGLDLDGTIVEPKSGKAFPINGDDWRLLFNNKLTAKLNEYHNAGYKLIIFSNQSGMSIGKQDVQDWQRKLDNIVFTLKLPILVMAAKETDYFRKPSIGMWKLMTEKFNKMEPDLSKCIYVGDAAGRDKAAHRKKDHNDSDYKFALNCGISFKTPEEFFLEQKEELPNFDFNPKDIKQDEYKAEDLISNKKEIIIFVGSPGSGKTSIFKKYLEPNGYIHINQDTLKTQPKCIKVAEQNLKEGKSVVIDCTNPAAKTRSVYVDLAKENEVPIRCFYFKFDKELVMHLNKLRKINNERQHHTKSVADVIIHTWFKHLEVPNVNEGFEEVKEIEFKPFFVNEKDKEIFYMYS